MSGDVRLQVSELAKRYGGVVAVKNMSFDLRAGEIVGLIGPNGSGKSTVMSLIMGVARTNSGTIKLDGVDITGWPAHRIARSGVSIVFQHSRPLQRQTVLENVKLALLPDSLLRLATEASVGERARADRRARGAWRRAAPAPLDAAVRRFAPDGISQGGSARSQGGADRRAVRRADARRRSRFSPILSALCATRAARCFWSTTASKASPRSPIASSPCISANASPREAPKR